MLATLYRDWKPLSIGGSRGRELATGRGVMIIVREALAERGKSLVGMRVVIQGLNVGSAVVLLLHEAGAKFWPVKGSGGIFAEAGSQPLKVTLPNRKRIAGFPGAVPFTRIPNC